MKEFRIRTCIIGGGFGKRMLLPVCEMHPRIEVTALVVKARIPVDVPEHVRVYTDLNQALQNSPAELVIVASPPFLHQEHVAAALQYGKHVLCEKPLALDASSAALLEEQRSNQGVVGAVDFSFRYVPARAYFTDLVRSGSIGTLQTSHISFFRNDFDSWPTDWYYDRNQGGGMLQATGAHLVDTAVMIHDSRIRWMCCSVTENKGIDTGFTLIMEAESGSVCTIAVSHTTPGQGKHVIEAHGTNGSLFLDENGDLIRVINGTPSPCPIPEMYFYGFSDSKWDANPRMLPTARIIEATASAITEGGSVDAIGFPAAVENQKIIDAARESYRTGRRIYLGT